MRYQSPEARGLDRALHTGAGLRVSAAGNWGAVVRTIGPGHSCLFVIASDYGGPEQRPVYFYLMKRGSEVRIEAMTDTDALKLRNQGHDWFGVGHKTRKDAEAALVALNQPK